MAIWCCLRNHAGHGVLFSVLSQKAKTYIKKGDLAVCVDNDRPAVGLDTTFFVPRASEI